MFKTKILFATALSLVALGLNNIKVNVLAVTKNVNPLEIKERDPLLPNTSIERPLTPLEKFKLNKEILKLEERAKTESIAGNNDRAFQIWYRILRLKRKLDRLEEIKALGEIGSIAWEKNRKNDVEIITERLQIIEREVIITKKRDRIVLLAFGVAYQKLRAIDPAIATYEQILAEAKQQQDNNSKISTSKTLGQLYLTKFDYSKAAIIYEELLKIAREKRDNFNVGIYLAKLAEIYDRAALPENALIIKQQLQKQYLSSGNIKSLVKLKISIAEDYETIEEPEKASSNYQEAFDLAWSLQNLAAASEALEKLGNLYLDYNQPLVAVQIYQQLVKVQQQSYNFFGLMTTYDRLGQIYLKQKNFSEAINAFQQGKEIARSLQYRENYFVDRINRVNKQKRD